MISHQLPAARSRGELLGAVLPTVLVAALAVPALRSIAPTAWNVLLVAAMTLPLLLRLAHPTAVFTVTYLGTALALLTQTHPLVSFGVLVALYAVAATRPRRTTLTAGVALELLALAASLHLARHEFWNAAVFTTGTVLGALALGLYSGTRYAYLAELTDRAERLERERDQQVALAQAGERARIARELHDIVAHHLTVMVALSDGAGAAAVTAPEQAADAMRAVSATGRRALADTRRLLGVLRDDAGEPDSRAPVPDVAELDALVSQVRAAGLPVSYEVRGSRGELPPGIGLTVYRLVQEALTNTLKHGGTGVSATVRLRYDPGAVLVEVEDDGAGRLPAGAVAVGRGLTGMRERAAAFGGEVSAGPRRTGGWAVSALLRHDEEPAP